jgi:polyisoprenoid-binding protein YceI
MEETVLYRIDTQKSLFTVHPFATGLAATLSHGLNIAIRDFTGEIRFVPGTLQQARIRIKVKTDSLRVTDDMKESDRREIERAMKEEVLRTAEHPVIEFKSSSIKAYKTMESHYRLEVSGDLTLNGVLRSQPLEAIVVVGEDTLRANGKFEALQSDYKIKPISAAGGLIKVHDLVKFHFYIVAQRAASESQASA